MTPLGTFAVTAEGGEVAAFRAATGLAPGDEVPATYAMRWLAAPEVRAATLAMVPEPDVVPVHESQTFDFIAPLTVGSDYRMEIAARRETAPERLILDAAIRGGDGAPCLRVETILRLFSTVPAAA